MHKEHLLSRATGSSVDLTVAHRHSESSCGTSVDMVEMVPIMDRVCLLTPGPICPHGHLPEKLLEAGHFRALDLGPVKEGSRRDGSDEHTFNISGSFDRYAVCDTQTRELPKKPHIYSSASLETLTGEPYCKHCTP